MIGKSAAINQLRQAIDNVAPTNSRVLIPGAVRLRQGACGPRDARESLRAEGPFVVLNAAAMAPDRVEDELFGTEDRTARARARSARSKKRTTARSISTRSPTCRSRRKARSCACSSSRSSSGSAAVPKVQSTCASFPRPAAIWSEEIAGGPLPRGPVPPPQRRAAARAGRWPSGARTFPSLSSYFVAQSSRSPRAWPRADRRGRHRRAAGRTIGRATCASSATTSSG